MCREYIASFKVIEIKRGKSMSCGEEQKKEIETIKERKITLKLSDADCDRLARKCGEHGLTIGELIENFVGDLVGGTYSNGSDERDYADQWFERCWFGMFPMEIHCIPQVQ